MLTYPWKCTVLHCNHLGNTWKPLVLMTRHFDYCPSVSEGDNQSVRSSAPVVSRCFPGGYNVKLYISRGRLAWWLLAFLHSDNKFQSVGNKFLISCYMAIQQGWCQVEQRHVTQAVCILNSYSASCDNWCTVGGDGGCRVGEVRAGTTSPMPDHKGFKLQ